MADVTLVSFGAGRGACDEIVSCFHFCPLVCSFLSFARSLALARARARATDCTNEFVPAHIVAAWLAKRLKARRAPYMLSLSLPSTRPPRSTQGLRRSACEEVTCTSGARTQRRELPAYMLLPAFIIAENLFQPVPSVAALALVLARSLAC